MATNNGRGQTPSVSVNPLFHCHIVKKAKKYPPKNNPTVGFQKLGGSTYSLISLCQLNVFEVSGVFFLFLLVKFEIDSFIL